eukprot:SAG31_NODE_5116_length_2731_cov_1.876900_5_plen_150_part_00
MRTEQRPVHHSWYLAVRRSHFCTPRWRLCLSYRSSSCMETLSANSVCASTKPMRRLYSLIGCAKSLRIAWHSVTMAQCHLLILLRTSDYFNKQRKYNHIHDSHGIRIQVMLSISARHTHHQNCEIKTRERGWFCAKRSYPTFHATTLPF